MSNNNLNPDEFKLVSRRKRRTKSTNDINLATVIHPVSYEHFDLRFALMRIEYCKEDLLKSDVYSSVLASLRESLSILHSPEIKEIVCFGLGRIGECMIARYQLALLLCLRNLYNVKVIVYDPIFNEHDHSILNVLDFDLLHNNLEGKYRIEEKDTTIFYLPHCPKQLTNNLLWTNWGLQLNRCIIITNSFQKIIESNSKRHISDNAEYILNISSHTTELAVINSFRYFEIFNDTAIHVFPWEKISLISQDFWDYNKEPTYTNSDIEFVTKKLEANLKL